MTSAQLDEQMRALAVRAARLARRPVKPVWTPALMKQWMGVQS